MGMVSADCNTTSELIDSQTLDCTTQVICHFILGDELGGIPTVPDIRLECPGKYTLNTYKDTTVCTYTSNLNEPCAGGSNSWTHTFTSTRTEATPCEPDSDCDCPPGYYQ